MRKVITVVISIVLLYGCASSQVASRMGVEVGNGFSKSYQDGTVNIDAHIKAWPYVSGLIKGIYANNYDTEVPKIAQDIISNLDKLADKETLTDYEKGVVRGYFVRLEAIAIEQGWNRYGVNIYNMIRTSMSGM